MVEVHYEDGAEPVPNDLLMMTTGPTENRPLPGAGWLMVGCNPDKSCVFVRRCMSQSEPAPTVYLPSGALPWARAYVVKGY